MLDLPAIRARCRRHYRHPLGAIPRTFASQREAEASVALKKLTKGTR